MSGNKALNPSLAECSGSRSCWWAVEICSQLGFETELLWTFEKQGTIRVQGVQGKLVAVSGWDIARKGSHRKGEVQTQASREV
jgi:hypothetical protein